MNRYSKKTTNVVGNNLTFYSFRFFPMSKPFWSTAPVVFTLWESIRAWVGSSLNPALWRVSFTRCSRIFVPKTVKARTSIKAVDGENRRKIMRQISPLTTRFHQVQHRIDQFALFPFVLTHIGEQGRDDVPLFVR